MAKRREQPLDFLSDGRQVAQRPFGLGDGGLQIRFPWSTAPGDFGRQVTGRHGTRFRNCHALGVGL